MVLTVVQLLAIVLTALALVPAGAHFFELPNKIAMPQEAYFTVQSIYRGWALFGIVLFGALAANLALSVMHRRNGRLLFLPCSHSPCWRRRWSSSSPGPSRPTRRPATGRRFPTTGRRCGHNGSTRTPPTQS